MCLIPFLLRNCANSSLVNVVALSETIGIPSEANDSIVAEDVADTVVHFQPLGMSINHQEEHLPHEWSCIINVNPRPWFLWHDHGCSGVTGGVFC